MSTRHLTKWDQEEYVLGQRTPDVIQHLAQCPACQASVARLGQSVELFRSSAMEWSARSLERHPLRTTAPLPSGRHSFVPAWQWACVVCLVFLALLPVYVSIVRTQQHQAARVLPPQAAPISDDALLQQVDEEVSESVPASMEPLTHLVTADREVASHVSTPGRQHRAQAN